MLDHNIIKDPCRTNQIVATIKKHNVWRLASPCVRAWRISLKLTEIGIPSVVLYKSELISYLFTWTWWRAYLLWNDRHWTERILSADCWFYKWSWAGVLDVFLLMMWFPLWFNISKEASGFIVNISNSTFMLDKMVSMVYG